jgi:hypothetical protein
MAHTHHSSDYPDNVTGPLIHLNNPSNNSIVKPFTSIDFNITDPDGVDVVIYHWDMIANDTLNPPYHLAARTSQVTHWLFVYANDTYDNWATALFVFTTDGTPPLVTLFTPANDSMHYSGIIVAVNVSDDHLSQVLYHWDNQSGNTTWLSPYETTLPIGEGPHILYVYANDSAGNVAGGDYVFYTHDGVPIINLLGLTNESIVRSTVKASVNVVDQALDTVLYAWDNVGDYVPWFPPYETLIPSGEENPVLYVWANNTLASFTQVCYSFIVDDLPPEITLLSPANLSVCVGGTQVAFDISDQHLLSVILRWEDTLNNSTWSYPYLTSTPLADGNHTLLVYAYDLANNARNIRAVFAVDNMAPSVVLCAPNNGSVVQSRIDIELSITDLHFSQAWFSWDDGLNASLSSPFVITLPLTDGWHRLLITANDSAGNIAWIVFAWKIDNSAPLISLQSDITMHQGDARQNITWRAADVNPAHYQILCNGLSLASGSWNSSSETFVVLLTTYNAGTYNLTIVVEDLAGNQASSSVFVHVLETTLTSTSVTISTTTMTATSISTIDGILAAESIIVISSAGAALVIIGLLVIRLRGRDSTSAHQ